MGLAEGRAQHSATAGNANINLGVAVNTWLLQKDPHLFLSLDMGHVHSCKSVCMQPVYA